MRCLACRVVDSTWRTLRTLRDTKWRRRTPFLLTLWFLYFQSTAPSSTQERTTDDKQWSLRSGPLFSDATNDKLSSYGKNNENRNSPRKKTRQVVCASSWLIVSSNVICACMQCPRNDLGKEKWCFVVNLQRTYYNTSIENRYTCIHSELTKCKTLQKQTIKSFSKRISGILRDIDRNGHKTTHLYDRTADKSVLREYWAVWFSLSEIRASI